MKKIIYFCLLMCSMHSVYSMQANFSYYQPRYIEKGDWVHIRGDYSYIPAQVIDIVKNKNNKKQYKLTWINKLNRRISALILPEYIYVTKKEIKIGDEVRVCVHNQKNNRASFYDGAVMNKINNKGSILYHVCDHKNFNSFIIAGSEDIDRVLLSMS